MGVACEYDSEVTVDGEDAAVSSRDKSPVIVGVVRSRWEVEVLVWAAEWGGAGGGVVGFSGLAV